MSTWQYGGAEDFVRSTPDVWDMSRRISAGARTPQAPSYDPDRYAAPVSLDKLSDDELVAYIEAHDDGGSCTGFGPRSRQAPSYDPDRYDSYDY